MCSPTTKSGASGGAQGPHEALLALHEVLAKYNASIRVKYPPSAPLARVMERSTSGWINDAPSVIQEFKHAAEDAIYAELMEDHYLGDGVKDFRGRPGVGWAHADRRQGQRSVGKACLDR